MKVNATPTTATQRKEQCPLLCSSHNSLILLCSLAGLVVATLPSRGSSLSADIIPQ
jgi:hypothetical protein